MKTIHSTKFVFTEEEIAHVHAVYRMLNDMEDYDYEEMCDQIENESNYDFHEFFDSLINLLSFMENRIDLQDN